MDVKRLKNIISVEERNDLVSWIVSNTNTFSVSGHPGTIRLTTRFLEEANYPEVAFLIRSRIEERLGITSPLYPPFPSGMVASYGDSGDECGFHIDPVWFTGYKTYHCVVLLTKPDHGGIPVIGGKEYPIDECEGLFYPVSEIEHGTTMMTGSSPRLLWIFGFCIKD